MAKVNKKTLILILALATFTVCFLCGLAILIGDSEPTAELAQVSATATKAATGTATEIPQPTSRTDLQLIQPRGGQLFDTKQIERMMQ